MFNYYHPMASAGNECMITFYDLLPGFESEKKNYSSEINFLVKKKLFGIEILAKIINFGRK